MDRKPILCLDFDGVIHDYRRGWQDGEIYGNITPGFWEWAEKASEFFKLVIFSSRSVDPEAIAAMQFWLHIQRKKWRHAGHMPDTDEPLEFEFSERKPPAFLTIDDRALTFKGDWSEFEPRLLRQFMPWMGKN